ncbi:MAG: hypothetical protein JO320_05510 [Alphaproteobacteria bacterium]|nr:hypothetical protein [Alphaproteobacteria bacterium]MBV9814199.1 hypothetical protein [Alphaproteobacteria bacterium]
MSVFELANEHPLTKAGLVCVHLVEKPEPGLRPGDIVFEFPFGRIVDTAMACRRDRIIPAGVDLMAVHKEAIAIREARKEISETLTARNVIPLRRQGGRPLRHGDDQPAE